MFPTVWSLKTFYLYAMSSKELVVLIICQILMNTVRDYLSFLLAERYRF
jgi:hypothetical protein